MITSTALLIATAGLAAGAPAAQETRTDKDKLQGTWVFQSVEVAGEAAPRGDFEGLKVVIEGDAYTQKKDKEVEEKGILKLDPTRTPKQIDFEIAEGENKGQTQLGIYKLEGDTLTICFTDPGSKERPKEFATKAGIRAYLVVLKREKQP